MDNNVTLVGNTTREIELKYLPSGVAVGEVGLAINRRWTDKATGETKEDVGFFDVVLWDTLATNAADTIPKGTRVIVSGMLQYRTWENDAGEKRSKIEVKADSIGPELRWASAVVTKNDRPSTNGERAPHTAATSSGKSTDPFD